MPASEHSGASSPQWSLGHSSTSSGKLGPSNHPSEDTYVILGIQTVCKIARFEGETVAPARASQGTQKHCPPGGKSLERWVTGMADTYF